ncbi:hypothetical protein PMIN07_005463 [Paraphaeosphaeria minitans]
MAENSSLCLTGAAPIYLANTFVCNAGFYCPESKRTEPPQYCPPTKECQAVRLQMAENTCDQPQGLYEPIVCTKGYYCPRPGDQRYLCPDKHYCPLGTESPVKCGPLSVCPSGSSREFHLDGFVVAMILDIVLLIIVFVPLRLGVSNLDFKKYRKDSQSSSEEVLEVAERPTLLSIPGEHETNYPSISITYEEITFELSELNRPVVSSVSGSIQRGILCGILGPSGAGKTTLMRLLMGKIEPTKGIVKVNGSQTTISRLKKLTGYVPSDDILPSHLTVYETILHACRLRGPRNWSEKQRSVATQSIMQSLGILHIQHQLVGDQLMSLISSGQRKRVSIATELIAAPMMLFLDEPTSGLDSTTAMVLIDLLKKISGTGVIVVCILHQPRQEIFVALDHVMLMAEGMQLYEGSPGEAASYFSSHGFEISKDANPADCLLDIAASKARSASPHIGTVNMAQQLARMWEQQQCIQNEAIQHTEDEIETSELAPDAVVDLERTAALRGASWLRQVQYCHLRAMKQQLRQPFSLLLEIAVGGVAGLLIGLGLYSNKGMHFEGVYLTPFEMLSSAVDYSTVPKIGNMITLAIALAASAPGVSTFGDEKPLYWREAAAGHRRSAYFTGKVLATIPRMTLSSLHFASFYAILATPSINFWLLYVLVLLYFYCVYGLASAVSVAVKRENGALLAMILCLIIGAFGGYAPMLSNVQSWHLEWLWRLCPGTWLTEAYFDLVLKRVEYLYDVHAAAAWTGFSLRRTSLDVVMILIIGTFYRAVTFAGLVFFDRDKQR